MTADVATEPARKPTGSAAWKFEVLDTCNADPKASGACHKVLAAYLRYGRKPFMGMSELMLRTGLSKPTVIAARRKLEDLGYLKALYPVGDGAMLYMVCNPRKDLIADHISIGLTSIREAAADRKKLERIRAQMRRGGEEILPPDDDAQERNFTPARKVSLPNSVEILRRKKGYEEGNPSSGLRSAPLEGDRPFPVPTNETDARLFIVSALDGKRPSPAQVLFLQQMLMRGTLRPSQIEALESAA